MSTSKRNYKQQKRLNNISYLIWFERLASIAMCRYKWEGLPDTCDEEMIEWSNFYRGKVSFFRDEGLNDIVSLPFIPAQTYNIYGYPVEIQPFSRWGNINYDVIKAGNFVICFDTVGRWNTFMLVDYYAMRLSDLQRTIDTNLSQQKTIGGAIVGSEAQKNSVITAMQQTGENVPFVILDKDMWERGSRIGDKPITLEAIKFDVPYIADKLQIQKNMLLNEFLTAIGIENTNADKRERLVADETNANIGAIESARLIGLTPRQRACDKLKKTFGINVSVEVNSNIKTLINDAFNIWDLNGTREGENND